MPQHPLGPQDLEQINENLRQLDEADILIQRAQSAGIDVTDRKAQSIEARSKLNRLKSAFFPG